MRFLKLNIVLLLILPLTGYAQISNDSLNFLTSNFNDRVINSNLQKQLNTTNLNSSISYFHNSSNYFLGISEHYLSTVIKSGTKNIRDEQNLSLLGEYLISQKLKIGLLTQNNIYSDNRKIALNEATLFTSSVFTKYSPLKNLKIIPFGGYSINKQVGEDDRGFLYGAEAVLQKTKYNNFQIESVLKLHNEDISPRKNTLRFLGIRIANKFEDMFSNNISANFSEVRKDFYFSADSLLQKSFNITHNIQSRIERNYLIEDKLRYASKESNFSLGLAGRIYWRDIDRNTRYILTDYINPSSFDSGIQEFKLNFSGNLGYKVKRFNSILKFEYSEREEQHSAKKIEGANNIFYEDRQALELKKNNQSSLATVSAALAYKFSRKDNLALSILQRKLIYDTPSAENFDDRDELLTIFRIYYSRFFNPTFNFFINLEGSINHIVYIFAERSSNNNIRRVLKLTSGGTYKTGYLSSTNSAEVSANYTVFDFEDLIPNVKSFAFRQFVVRDSTNLKLIRNISVGLNAYIKLSEQGDFNWTDFSSKPQRFLAEYFAIPKFILFRNKLIISLGMRFFSLTSYKYNSNNIKYKDSNYRSIGPLVEFSYNLGLKLNINFNGWYEFINTETNVKKEVANMNLKLNWNI